MGTWGPAIFSDDTAADIRGEYNALISVGKENDEAEKLLMDDYAEILHGGDEEEPVFWFALALAEWNKGRLSEYVKSKALTFLENGGDLERWDIPGNEKNYLKRKKVIEELEKKLKSPMPPQKRMKIRGRHCPWKVGSLLAYRIVTNEEKLKDDSYFGKYVLLRIVKIERHPIARLAPDEQYDETMLVGLYKWFGDEIPDPEITKQLEFTPVADYTLKLLGRRIETCTQLDWRPTMDGKKGDFTYLGRDVSYEEHTPEFFKTHITQYAMSGLYSFDLTVALRLKQLFGG